ncbi:MAG: hypothetical protein HC836_45245 [Richelia sp. RM2_1_2]|nr:hypothetical protein [Richelia sp. RM2_1_2]
MQIITNKEYGQVLALVLLKMKRNISQLENHLLDVIEQSGDNRHNPEIALGILNPRNLEHLTNINEILINI